MAHPIERSGFFLKSFLTLVLLGLLAGAGIFLYATQGMTDGETRELVITRGSSMGQVAQFLAKNEIIQHPRIFKLLLRLTGGSRRLRAGEFRFQTGMSPMAALTVLYHDEPIVHQVTIPEGWTVRQIAEILTQSKLVDFQRFLTLAHSKSTAARYQLSSPTLEGFLYPDTYAFSRIDGEEKIVDTMVKQFFQKFTPEMRAETRRMGWTVEQVVTLASIIERETGVPDERPLIASVFHNRLQKRMRLQSDPTTIYGMADSYKGNLSKADLKRFSPYNTYTITGLPPGAIASPGEASLRAVLYPAKSDYLFFVARNNGSHIFSKTYSEHARHVNTFQPLIVVRPNRKHK